MVWYVWTSGIWNCFAIGRLGKEKSVDVLIDGQKEIIKRYKNVKLMIVGDGPDMEYFKKMVSN